MAGIIPGCRLHITTYDIFPASMLGHQEVLPSPPLCASCEMISDKYAQVPSGRDTGHLPAQEGVLITRLAAASNVVPMRFSVEYMYIQFVHAHIRNLISKSSSTINLHILTCLRDELHGCQVASRFIPTLNHHQRCIHRTSDIPNIYCRTSDRHEGQCLFVTIANEMMNEKGCIIHTTCVDSID